MSRKTLAEWARSCPEYSQRTYRKWAGILNSGQIAGRYRFLTKGEFQNLLLYMHKNVVPGAGNYIRKKNKKVSKFA